MKIRFIKSSCVIIETAGLKILCDPWLIDGGAYYGSWVADYPPLKFDSEKFSDIDYIYISHIHPDHLDPNTLKHFNKKIPILIHKFQTQLIRDTFYKNIEPLGFKIIELPHNQKYNLNDQVQINILVADGCDPSLCGKHFGCNPTTENDSSMQIDTLCVINDSKYTIVNTNDSPIELTKPKVLPQIKQQYKKIDFLLHGYTMAGHYPQCTVSLTKNEMLKESERVMKLNYERCMGYIRYLNPDFYMPFAGRYLLSGKLSQLNNFTANFPPIHAKKYLEENYEKELKNMKCVVLNAFEYFDLEKKEQSKKYKEYDKKEFDDYVEHTLSKIKFSYENDDVPTEEKMYSLFEQSYKRMNTNRKIMGFETDTDVYIKLFNNELLYISMNGNGFSIVQKNHLEKNDKYILMDLDFKLLYRILRGPKYAHWSNADVGSHIKYIKKPNIFERGIYRCMYFFYS